MFSPFISIIIPTRNRAQYLSELIHSLCAQIQKNSLENQIEILIIDDQSNNRTRRRITRCLSQLSFSWIQCIHLQGSTSQPKGPAYARNVGVSRSKGEIILFMDDDQITAEDYLPEMIRLHKEHSEVLIINGTIEPLENNAFSRFWHLRFKAAFDGNPSQLHEIDRVAIGNCSIKRRLLDRVNPLLDSSLTVQEDFDLAYRLFEMKIPIYKSDRLVALNHCPRSLLAFLKKHHWYEQGTAAMKKKYPGYARQAKFKNNQVRIENMLQTKGICARLEYSALLFCLRVMRVITKQTS